MMRKVDGVIKFRISKGVRESLERGIQEHVLPFWRHLDAWREWSIEQMKRDKRKIR